MTVEPKLFATFVAQAALQMENLALRERVPGAVWEALQEGEVLKRPLLIARGLDDVDVWCELTSLLENFQPQSGAIVMTSTDAALRRRLPHNFKLQRIADFIALSPTGFKARAPVNVTNVAPLAPSKRGRQSWFNPIPCFEQRMSQGRTLPQIGKECEEIYRELVAANNNSPKGVPTVGTIANKIRKKYNALKASKGV